MPRTPERTLRTFRLCLALAPSMSPTRGIADARVEYVYDRARQLSEESDDPVQLFQALLGVVGAYTAQARLDQAWEAAQQLERLLPMLPLPPFVFVGSFAIATVKYHIGSLLEARQLLERALSIADVTLPPLSMDVRAAALGYLALVLVHLGHADQSRACLEQAASRPTALERLFDRGLVAHIACFVHLVLHDGRCRCRAAANRPGVRVAAA